MKHFTIGERVTYYPPKQHETDNLHWPATVTGESPSRRIRVEVETPDGIKRRAVSAKRLAHQAELEV